MARRSWLRNRGVTAALVAVILIVQSVMPVAAQGAVIEADNSAGHGIVAGEVKDPYAPGRAIVSVQNLRRFWVAIEPVEHWGSTTFDPAPTTGPHADLGGAWATIAVIPPLGTAAYDLSVDPRAGGSQAFRVHYDGTSVGGLAAVALNVVQLVAHVAGDGQLKGGAAAAGTAIRALTQLPEWEDIVRKNQGDAMALTDLPAVVKALLGSGTGRSALREALKAVGIEVGLGTLRNIATGVSGAEVLLFLKDLGEAVGKGQVDGSVSFYAVLPTGSESSVDEAPRDVAGEVGRPVDGWIAYSLIEHDANGGWTGSRIHVVTMDGADGRPVGMRLPPGHLAANPIWSHSGRYLAYLTRNTDSAPNQLRVIDFGSGADLRLLVVPDVGKEEGIELQWASADQLLAGIVVPKKGYRPLLRVGANGSGRGRVPIPDGMYVQDFQVSPDGSRIALTMVDRGEGGEQGIVATIDPQTWEVRELTNVRSAWALTWSPDGRRFAAIVSDREEDLGIWLFDPADGSHEVIGNLRRCTALDCPAVRLMWWSVDGSHLLIYWWSGPVGDGGDFLSAVPADARGLDLGDHGVADRPVLTGIRTNHDVDVLTKMDGTLLAFVTDQGVELLSPDGLWSTDLTDALASGGEGSAVLLDALSPDGRHIVARRTGVLSVLDLDTLAARSLVQTCDSCVLDRAVWQPLPAASATR